LRSLAEGYIVGEFLIQSLLIVFFVRAMLPMVHEVGDFELFPCGGSVISGAVAATSL
jgi:hypothetical protein